MFGRALILVGLLAIIAPTATWAQESTGPSPLTLGTVIARAVLILLAGLIALSVLAKLSIVFGIVPRTPENRFHGLVHGAANFVGRLRPPRSIRDQRRSSRLPDDQGR